MYKGKKNRIVALYLVTAICGFIFLFAFQNCSDVRLKGFDNTPPPVIEIPPPVLPPPPPTEASPVPEASPNPVGTPSVLPVQPGVGRDGGAIGGHYSGSRELYGPNPKPPFVDIVWTGKYFIVGSNCGASEPSRKGIHVFTKVGQLVAEAHPCTDAVNGVAQQMVELGFTQAQGDTEAEHFDNGMNPDGNWTCAGGSQSTVVISEHKFAKICSAGTGNRGVLFYEIKEVPTNGNIWVKFIGSAPLFTTTAVAYVSGLITTVREPKYGVLGGPSPANTLAGFTFPTATDEPQFIRPVFSKPADYQIYCGAGSVLLGVRGVTPIYAKINGLGDSVEVFPHPQGMLIDKCETSGSKIAAHSYTTTGHLIRIYETSSGAPVKIKELSFPAELVPSVPTGEMRDRLGRGMSIAGQFILAGRKLWVGNQGPFTVDLPQISLGFPLSEGQMAIEDVAITPDGYIGMVRGDQPLFTRVIVP